MMEHEPAVHSSPVGSRRSFLRSPILPLIVAIVAIALTWLVRSLDSTVLSPANVNIASLVVIGLSVIFITVWIRRWSPLSPRVRRVIIGTELSVLVLIIAAFRIEGTTGDLLPRLVPRWQRKSHALLPTPAEEASRTGPIQLIASPEKDYAQFLGPRRNATLDGPELESDWARHPPREIWRRPIGAGWSSFAVVGDYAFTQEQRGEEELVTCYHVTDGQLQWAHADTARFSDVFGGDGPRGTPTVHEGFVYSIGATGIINCLNAETGERVWRHDVVAETQVPGPPQYGYAGSPLIVENSVIVNAGGPDGKSLIAYDRLTGAEVWSAGSDPASYSSPTIKTMLGVQQILLINDGSVTGHDPTDGRVLWRFDWAVSKGSPTAAQPLPIDDAHLLVSKGYGVGAVLLKLERTDDRWSVEAVWRKPVMKTKFSNPILYDGFVYGLDEGMLQCLDPIPGKPTWKKNRNQRYGHGQLLLVDKLLLVQCEEPGDLALVAPRTDGLEELARVPALEEKSWNNPALSGRLLLVRNGVEAACFELPIK